MEINICALLLKILYLCVAAKLLFVLSLSFALHWCLFFFFVCAAPTVVPNRSMWNSWRHEGWPQTGWTKENTADNKKKNKEEANIATNEYILLFDSSCVCIRRQNSHAPRTGWCMHTTQTKIICSEISWYTIYPFVYFHIDANVSHLYFNRTSGWWCCSFAPFRRPTGGT